MSFALSIKLILLSIPKYSTSVLIKFNIFPIPQPRSNTRLPFIHLEAFFNLQSSKYGANRPVPCFSLILFRYPTHYLIITKKIRARFIKITPYLINGGFLKLSIIIPAYNESGTIKELLRRVKAVNLHGIKKEIIVIDDGSTDDTVNIVGKIGGVKLIKHAKNQGKGAAIRTGIKYATGDIIIIQDADLEYNPYDYYKLIKPIIENKTKVVYGSRFLSKAEYTKRHKKFVKGKHIKAYSAFYYGGRFLTFLANLLYNAKITDEATCYKVFKADVLKNLNLKCNRFEFCPEVTAKVRKKGYKIMEIPTSYKPRTMEEGKKINWKDGIEAVWTLIKYGFVD